MFVHYNMRLRARNLERIDREWEGAYHPINLEYIFQDDDPLESRLRGGEQPLLPDDNFVNENEDGNDDDDDAIQSSIPPQRASLSEVRYPP